MPGLTASRPYDIFAYDNAGTVTLEALAWTNATTRATALTTQDGVLVKSGATTRRYVGTIYINDSESQTDDTEASRFVWNYYNRVQRSLRVIDTTTNWTYTTDAWRQARGSTGVAEVTVDLTVLAHPQNTIVSIFVRTAIGEDSTTAPLSGAPYARTETYRANAPFFQTTRISRMPSIGYHYYAWLERSSAGGTTTWEGTAGSEEQSGMSGTLHAG